MPSTPSSPILRHRSIGNWSLRSISAARGAISAWANACTASRSASMSSPSMKFRPGRLLISRLLGWRAALARRGTVGRIVTDVAGCARQPHRRILGLAARRNRKTILVDVYVNVNQTGAFQAVQARAARLAAARRGGAAAAASSSRSQRASCWAISSSVTRMSSSCSSICLRCVAQHGEEGLAAAGRCPTASRTCRTSCLISCRLRPRRLPRSVSFRRVRSRCE